MKSSACLIVRAIVAGLAAVAFSSGCKMTTAPEATFHIHGIVLNGINQSPMANVTVHAAHPASCSGSEVIRSCSGYEELKTAVTGSDGRFALDFGDRFCNFPLEVSVTAQTRVAVYVQDGTGSHCSMEGKVVEVTLTVR